MVKKDAGKGDKKQPKEAFDPLLVESSHAGTVVLMLDSTEEEVVVKATEALYKFSEKCDVNRHQLLQLDMVPRAITLLASETSVIHRNACMILGSMSRHTAVARTLKKLDIIPTLVKLLGPEEETVVNEYAALTLVSLVGYYSCKRTICENKGIDALIRCLGSSDADVQKNSISTLAILVQDIEAKTLIREANGIVPVCDLMRSEYAVIQNQTLVTLQLLAEDASNRQAIRDTSAIVELFNIIANSNFSDIHCPSVNVIANLFEDFDTLQLMRDNGTLKKLISLASDIPPVAEDKKTKGKDKDKPSSPAKGKKGKASVADDNSKTLESSTAFVPLLAEVKELIALAFQRAAKNDESRKLLTEQELEKLLIVLVNHCDQQVQIAASHAIHTMAQSFISRDILGKLGGCKALVKMITCESMHLQVAAVRALSVLTTSSEFNCQEIMKYEGSQPLICLLQTEEEAVADDVLTILMNMGTDDQLNVELRSLSVISALVKLLSFESERIQSKASAALCLFVVADRDRDEFVSCCGVLPLLDLLSSSNKDVKRSATTLIASLAADEKTSAVFCHRGALDVLRYMQTSCEANAHVDIAIHKLLHYNICSKYALTGRLEATDIITDGFYDVGQLKLGQPFMPIEWYCNEPVNTKRPVLYVNIQPSTRQHDGASTQTAHGHDDRLTSMIEEVTKLLEPLKFASDAERAIALAQFVACQMGGKIDKGNFSGFSWELHISRIKYELRSNVIPIGRIEAGIHYHRALLFKVIGDRTGIPSALVRGEFNRAWNELQLSEQSEFDAVRFPPKTYIVDLVYEPGRLMKADSADAVVYRQL